MIKYIFQEEFKNSLKEWDICHYWYFKNIGFKYECNSIERYLCNGRHGLMQKAISFNDVAVASIKGSDYRTHFWHMGKNDVINIMKNFNFNKKSRLL